MSCFRSEVGRAFPAEVDNFERLVARLLSYDDMGGPLGGQSARPGGRRNDSRSLVDRDALLPADVLRSASRDTTWTFLPPISRSCFRSIFFEGLARPFAGIRLILKHLVKKFRDLGGELARCGPGVSRLATAADSKLRFGAARRRGQELAAHDVLSSAGWVETMRMCDGAAVPAERPAGQLSFLETASVLNVPPRDLGFDQTVVFFNDSEKFHWQKPDELVDVRSGVICSPNNFHYDAPAEEGMVRITALANFDRWQNLSEEEYREAKGAWYDRLNAAAIRFLPDFRKAVVDNDTFTPCTIRRFTWPRKRRFTAPLTNRVDRQLTHLKNLFICGTDQGFVGIIGALISGITIVNRHLLREKRHLAVSATGSTSGLRTVRLPCVSRHVEPARK